MKVSQLAHKLRTELIMEHFGLTYDEVKDPFEMRERIAAIADKNTKIYFDVFMCEPDNSIRSFKDVI